jgi:peptide subunit release factor 1 (eRF1)
VRELVERLGHVVDADRVDHILLAGDEVIVALIRAELPKRLAEKVVDTLHVDKKKPEAEIFSAAEEILRELDSKSDAERVDRLLGEYRAGGLAVVGPEEVRHALEVGQADELLISASLDRTGPAAEQAAADFVALARRTGTRVTFIEDPKLLAAFEGVGAFLRYKPAPAPETA